MTTLEAQHEVITNLILKNQKLKQECDEAKVAIRALAEHGESEIQRITKERDEALNKMADALQEVDLRNTLEIYPPASKKGKPVYFLEIYNKERWKLCLRNYIDGFSIPKFGWSGEGHPYTLGEGKIASEGLINMYTLSNLKRIVDGLNIQNEQK